MMEMSARTELVKIRDMIRRELVISEHHLNPQRNSAINPTSQKKLPRIVASRITDLRNIFLPTDHMEMSKTKAVSTITQNNLRTKPGVSRRGVVAHLKSA